VKRQTDEPDRPPMRLVVASQNRGKLREIEAMLVPLGITPVPIEAVAPGFSVVEDGTTFAANAALKAEAAHRATRLPVVADDSGLCVVGLGLGPGVHSARFGGLGDDVARCELLLREMAELTGESRRAWFACVMHAIVPAEWLAPERPASARARGDGRWWSITAEGRLEGAIGHHCVGDGGFGYDPLFLTAYDPARTLAELTAAEKNRISHRAQALGLLARSLRILSDNIY